MSDILVSLAGPGARIPGQLAQLLDVPPGFLEMLPVAIYACDAGGRILWFNGHAADLWGCAPRIGDEYERFCGCFRLSFGGHEARHDETPMAHVLRTGEPVHGSEGVVVRPDGTEVWAMVHIEPIKDAEGRVLGVINCFHDISNRKAAERKLEDSERRTREEAEVRQKLLLDELNHRVKNTLATVQSIASQTIRGARVPRSVAQAFERRLLALSRAHDHLSRGSWSSACFSEVLDDILAPFREQTAERIRLGGDRIMLSPKGALALAIVLHELAANAAKFGALSTPGGSVAVGWRTEDAPSGARLLIDWEEAGGPPVAPPSRRGFGTRVLDRAIRKELKGSAEMRFEPAGLCGHIDVPLASVQAA